VPRAPYPSIFAAFVVVVELRPVDAKNSHGCFLFSVALQHKQAPVWTFADLPSFETEGVLGPS